MRVVFLLTIYGILAGVNIAAYLMYDNIANVAAAVIIGIMAVISINLDRRLG